MKTLAIISIIVAIIFTSCYTPKPGYLVTKVTHLNHRFWLISLHRMDMRNNRYNFSFQVMDKPDSIQEGKYIHLSDSAIWQLHLRNR